MAHTASILNFEPANQFERVSSASSKTGRSRPILLRFGSFELDPRSGELTSTRTKVVLQRQPLQVLLMLIDRCGDMVSREELQERLWDNNVNVDFDCGINQLIRKLRRILGDSAEAPSYIETVARRGYRLKMPVEVIDKLSATAAPSDMALTLSENVPSDWKGNGESQTGTFGHHSSLRLREIAAGTRYSRCVRHTARCRARSFPEIEDRPDKLAGLFRSLASQSLRHHLSSSDPEATVDLLRQLLLLVAQFIEVQETHNEI